MDFNDIQSAWANDNVSNVRLPNQLEKLQTANMPLDKIRKNLKNEFIYQIISIGLMGFIPLYFKFPALMKTGFYVFYVLFVVICGYFLLKLYLFFKRLNKMSASTKDNLYDLYYDIRLNMELYKSFAYSMIPFVLIFVAMILLNAYYPNVTESSFQKTMEGLVWVAIVIFVVIIASMALITEWWVNQFYGKYAKEIKKVIDELKE